MAYRVKVDIGKLEALAKNIPDRIDRTIERSARRIERGAKFGAAADTGNMRNGIGVEDTGPGKRKIGAAADYAPFVELGTRFQPAQPFLKPAFDAEAPQLLQDLKRILD